MFLEYIRGSGTVDKEEVGVFDSVFEELLPVVLGLIQADHVAHSEVLENLEVILGLVPSLLLFVIDGAHKCYELAWNNPVQVSILNFLIVLILLGIKALERVPPILDR